MLYFFFNKKKSLIMRFILVQKIVSDIIENFEV